MSIMPASELFTSLELSTQAMADVATTGLELQPQPLPLPLSSRRLAFDLQDDAPPMTGHESYAPDLIRYPFSNDQCTAPYFDQLQVRVETEGYRQVHNPVAVLIGESALAANISFITEDTIVVMDKSPHMTDFMDYYVEALRVAGDRRTWFSMLEIVGPTDLMDFAGLQVDRWRNAGYVHPFTDDEVFASAQEQANRKTIVPWRADITSQADMAVLGSALSDRDATVTMMNLTNVLPYIRNLSPNQKLAHLGQLPVSAEAPIITTALNERSSRHFVGRILGRKTGLLNEVTGPFFGLDNLTQAIEANTSHPLGAIGERVYAG